MHPSSPQHLFPATALPAATIDRRSRVGPATLAPVPGPEQISRGAGKGRMRLVRGLSIALAAGVVVVPAVAGSSAAHAAPASSAGVGQLIPLAGLGGQGTYATTMNERGDIIGASIDAADEYRAVVWWQGRRAPTALGIAGARPAAISETGHIVGYVGSRLFLWRDGAVSYLKRPAAVDSLEASAINDLDQFVGTATDRDGASRAFLWQRGRLTMLPTPKGTISRAVDINNEGQIVGAVTRPGASAEQAVLWQQGRMTELGTLGGAGSTPVAINDLGQVSGNSAVAGSSDEHPFRWQDGRMTDLLAGTDATAGRVVDLTESGMMTGSASFGDHASRPVLWLAGQLTVIGLPGHVGVGTHVNERGDVTGSTWADPQGMAVPFRWRAGHTTLFPEPVGDIATKVVGIDRNGVIGVELETSEFGMRVLRSA